MLAFARTLPRNLRIVTSTAEFISQADQQTGNGHCSKIYNTIGQCVMSQNMWKKTSVGWTERCEQSTSYVSYVYNCHILEAGVSIGRLEAIHHNISSQSNQRVYLCCLQGGITRPVTVSHWNLSVNLYPFLNFISINQICLKFLDKWWHVSAWFSFSCKWENSVPHRRQNQRKLAGSTATGCSRKKTQFNAPQLYDHEP